MTIRAMTFDDLGTVLAWAEAEGWNPGLNDAAAFHAADPAGFLVKEVDGAPVAAVSVVNHDAAFAFLGLYLCKPGYRGQGHGWDVWRAGIAHAGTRCIGLDGVPEQQENYARSGFVKHGETIRYNGQIAAHRDRRIRPATTSDVAELVARDRTASGIDRQAFAASWVSAAPSRQTMILTNRSAVAGFATFRRCGMGTKVGPLHAVSDVDAVALLGANPFSAPGAPMFVDVPGRSTPLAGVLEACGFTPVFETARMWTGTPPNAELPPFCAIATMELG
ncbi:GNAT family N-acetyltransferase [uncultured Tateyamaria sp.]|uniref:GNAT family N-acetyltransferase n=1 Tax=Tateyamaria sp. 1078 TaxID=3417464 RepID=UPI002619A872|nr:GNAT family N-acetyltransferase [uncultured Tateyamaria sp.]